jgi:hypothetical protein
VTGTEIDWDAFRLVALDSVHGARCHCHLPSWPCRLSLRTVRFCLDVTGLVTWRRKMFMKTIEFMHIRHIVYSDSQILSTLSHSFSDSLEA